MTNQSTINRLRSEVLSKYPAAKRPRKYATLEPSVDSRKTLAMRVLEAHHGQSIEELLRLDQNHTGASIADRLGVSQTTITRWRQRLGLSEPYTERIKNGHDYGSG